MEISFTGDIETLPAVDSDEDKALKRSFAVAIAERMGFDNDDVIVTGFKIGSAIVSVRRSASVDGVRRSEVDGVIVVIFEIKVTESSEALEELVEIVSSGAVAVEGYPVIKDAPIKTIDLGGFGWK